MKYQSYLAGSVLLWLGLGIGQAVEIAIVGDSTASTYAPDSARRGWGQMLPEFLNADVTIRNEAERGKSTASFPPSRWQAILQAHPDFVLIQFGHNDQHKQIPLPDYQNNLRRYVREARGSGIAPVLVTPMHRRTFADGQLTTELEPYAKAMKDVGVEMNIPVIDLHAKSGAWFQALGDKGAEAFTVNFAEGGAREDRTHFNEAGARQLAQIIISSFAEIDSGLAGTVKKKNSAN